MFRSGTDRKECFAGGESSDQHALGCTAGLEFRLGVGHCIDQAHCSCVLSDIEIGVAGLAWVPSPPSGPMADANRFDLLGTPLDMSEYADWAATIPTQDFTEAECARYLTGSCADMVIAST